MAASGKDVSVSAASQDTKVMLSELKQSLTTYVMTQKGKELGDYASGHDVKFETNLHAAEAFLCDNDAKSDSASDRWCGWITQGLFGVGYGKEGDLGIARAKQVYALYSQYLTQGTKSEFLTSYIALLESKTFNGALGGSKHLEASCCDLLNKWMDLNIQRVVLLDQKGLASRRVTENLNILKAAHAKVALELKSIAANKK